jgi:glycosyltransferase involved in cell wall biosynthesis
VILFLSRLDMKKGLDLLLDGFARVRAVLPDAALVVAGRGEDRFVAGLRERAQRLGVQRDIIWAGFLEGQTKQAAFAAANVFALPSYSENFGIAVVEAMASGLPVIVSDQVGIHHEVTQAGAGIVVQCDQNEVCDALVKILSSHAERDRMAENARRLASQFSPAAVTARLLGVYHDLGRVGCALVH